MKEKIIFAFKNLIGIRLSALFMALILFLMSARSASASLPLTETINTIPEGGVELLVDEEFIGAGSRANYRRENYSLGLGILPDLSMWYLTQYLHNSWGQAKNNELGDSFLKLWYYLGDYIHDTLHFGFITRFRFPTGRDAFTETEWRVVSYGRNEVEIGPVIQYDIKRFFFHFNLIYVFREGFEKGFYDGFYFNLFEKRTYKKVFGLNFMEQDTFLEKDRLKNDYMKVSAALNTDLLYPFIFFIEFYSSSRLYKKDLGSDDIAIEGGTVIPFFISTGFRYFVKDYFYLGVYIIRNCVRNNEYIRDVAGIDLGLQF